MLQGTVLGIGAVLDYNLEAGGKSYNNEGRFVALKLIGCSTTFYRNPILSVQDR